MSKHLKEIQRSLHYTTISFEQIGSSQTGEELRRAWENYVDQFGKTIGQLITAANSEQATKGWGHRLKQSSAHDDEGLVYLREARNVSQHGLVPFGDYFEPSVVIGNGAISIGGTSKNITISNITENGVKIVGSPINFDTRNGRIEKFRGHRPSRMRELPAQVRLGTITSEQKKKSFHFPKSVKGKPLDDTAPLTLARVALRVLTEIVDDFEKVSSD